MGLQMSVLVLQRLQHIELIDLDLPSEPYWLDGIHGTAFNAIVLKGKKIMNELENNSRD